MKNSVQRSLRPLAVLALTFGALLARQTTAWTATTTPSASAIPLPADVIKAVQASSQEFRTPATSTPPLSDSFQSFVSVNPATSPTMSRAGCSINDNTTAVASDFLTRCAWGDVTSTKTIFLFGDSNAAMWIPALDTWGYLNHVKVIALTHGGCSPWSRPWMPHTAVFTANFTEKMCEAWRTNALAKGLSANPNLVIPVGIDLLSPYVAPRSDLLASINTLITTIGASRVAFIEPAPKFASLTIMASCVSTRPTSLNVCEVQTRYLAANSVTIVLQQIASQRKVPLISTKSFFCGPTYCPIFVKMNGTNWLVYGDGFHVSFLYSQQLGKSLAIGQYLK